MSKTYKVYQTLPLLDKILITKQRLQEVLDWMAYNDSLSKEEKHEIKLQVSKRLDLERRG